MDVGKPERVPVKKPKVGKPKRVAVPKRERQSDMRPIAAGHKGGVTKRKKAKKWII